jgi:zinc transport system ATP-binding protein
LLSCKDAAFGYEGRPVISGINLSIEAGVFFCLVGENGCGKSTLLQGLLGLLKPLSGSLIWSPHLNRKYIGYLSQVQAAKKDFPASAGEIVRSGLLGKAGLRPFFSPAEKRAAKSAMMRLGVEDLAGKCFAELSGGQQRRVLLARALCAAYTPQAKDAAPTGEKYPLLALDEPAAGLDPRSVTELYTLLDDLKKNAGYTIIMVSHDIENVEKYADTIRELNK